MPQCKMSNCREPALPTGKRYCAHHKAEYLRKQREYEAIQATLRICGCCGEKLSKTRHDNGEDLCGTCWQAEVDRAERNRKTRQFNDATTVEELKAWMREYMRL